MKDVELIYETEGCVTKAQRRRSKPGTLPNTKRPKSRGTDVVKSKTATPLTTCSSAFYREMSQCRLHSNSKTRTFEKVDGWNKAKLAGHTCSCRLDYFFGKTCNPCFAMYAGLKTDDGKKQYDHEPPTSSAATGTSH